VTITVVTTLISCVLTFSILHQSPISLFLQVSVKDFFSPSAAAAEYPKFVKEGSLTFLAKKSQKEIVKIDIEIADNDFERTRGLMYRVSLPDNAGMLFMFENSGPRSFWMRNTYISLDIIFADEKKKIVAIHRHAEPLSYEAIRAKTARYVIEVNAGFCDKHTINVGDSITFQRITPQHPTPSP